MFWRNNVGATPAECKKCGYRQQPVRYGLANDSEPLNKSIKSSDLIGIHRRLIRPEDVGTVIGQFAAVECKAPGWRYSASKREVAQLKYITLVKKLGGTAQFSTGELDL